MGIVRYCVGGVACVSISTMHIGITRNRRRRGAARGLILLLTLGVVVAACGGVDDDTPASHNRGTPARAPAPGIIGVEKGLLADGVGPDVGLRLSTYNAGPEAVEARSTGSIDATFI